jgi:hypothetical protein
MEMTEVTLPVTRAAAECLREPAKRARLGVLVSVALASDAAPGDLAEAVRLAGSSDGQRRAALREAFADMQRAAADAELSADEIEQELAAWRREKAIPGT